MNGADPEAEAGPQPIADAIDPILARASWRNAAAFILPDAPAWFHTAWATLMADPRATSDALLITADALDAGRREMLAEGNDAVARGLWYLADLTRNVAPHRAGARP